MTMHPPERKLVKLRIRISMKKPIETLDSYVKMPSRDMILENFAECIHRGDLDEYFEVVISRVKNQ